MVRLTDTLPEGKGMRPGKRDESGAKPGLPEILILSRRPEIVDLVRRALEDRGYRLHQAEGADEARKRLKAGGRVVLAADTLVEDALPLLREEIARGNAAIALAARDALGSLHLAGVDDRFVLPDGATVDEIRDRVESLVGGGSGEGPSRGAGSVLPAPHKSIRLSEEIPLEPTSVQAGGISLPGREPEGREPAAPTSPSAPEPTLEPAPELETATPGDPASAATPGRPLDSAPQEGPASGPAPVSGRTNRVYALTVEAIAKFMRGHRARSSPPLNELAHAVEGLLAEVNNSHEIFLEVIQHVPDFSDVDTYLAHHQANTAILAAKVGIGLGNEERMLYELVLSAAVHDVGMTRLPEGLVNRRGRLDQSGVTQVRQHPAYGRDILTAYDSAYPFLPQVAYQEHERFDGSGYPDGLQGDAIHPHARVVGLVDTYEALTHGRPFRERMIPFNVLQQLIRLGGRLFHSDLVKAFIEEISVFPLGSYVRLNTGEAGKVHSTNRGYPLRPMVEILYAADGTLLEQKRTLDLKQEPMLYITGPVDLKEVPEE